MLIYWNHKFDYRVLLSLATLFLAAISAPVHGEDLNIHQVAENVWMVQGVPEELSEENRGDISNSSFIATGNGVVVIDTGATAAYGRRFREVISEYTDEPIRWVINTHHHPDHIFGNSAFSDVPVMALSETRNLLMKHGDFYLKTVHERVGRYSEDTVVILPSVTVEGGVKSFSGYPLKLIRFSGHSGNDLVVYDPLTKILFAGDMLFWNRAPTTPHSPGIDIWLEEIDRLAELNPAVIIPGHGPLARDSGPIEQTRAWLVWLDSLMREGVAAGRSANALIDSDIPELLSDIPMAKFELTRSISHFYRKYEDSWWENANR